MNKRNLISTLIIAGVLCNFSSAAKIPDAVVNVPQEDSLNLLYSPETGNLSLSNLVMIEDPGDDSSIIVRDLTSLQITSTHGMFVDGESPEFATISDEVRPESFVGLFDIYEPTKVFKLVPNGFGGDISTIANVGMNMDPETLRTDIEVDGSFLGGGAIDEVGVFLVVPEPNSISLALFAALFCVTRIRRLR